MFVCASFQFFRMLKIGVPRGGVKQKMRQEGLDPAILDMDPNKPPPVVAEPPLQEHPKYAKVCRFCCRFRFVFVFVFVLLAS